MSEHPPQPPNEEPGPEPGEWTGVNPYGTDDPAEQARIEQARAAAHAERQRNRARLERYVEDGRTPDEAEALIEFEDSARERQAAAEADWEEEPDASDTGSDSSSEREKPIRPRIYVRSLVDYNEGHLVGDWVDAGQDADGIQADIQRILSRSLHAHWTGQPAEEWAIHDYEGFGSVRLDEHESLDVVSKLAKGIAEHGLAFAAWAELHDELASAPLERFAAAYIGRFDSREAFGEQVVSDHDVREVLERHLPSWLVRYISVDHVGIAQELEVDGEVRFADREGGGVWAFNGRV